MIDWTWVACLVIVAIVFYWVGAIAGRIKLWQQIEIQCPDQYRRIRRHFDL